MWLLEINSIKFLSAIVKFDKIKLVFVYKFAFDARYGGFIQH